LFDEKKSEAPLKSQVSSLLSNNGYDSGNLTNYTINRKNLAISLMQNLEKLSKKEKLKNIYCIFEGEIGIDEGGLMRELYSNATEEIFSPEFGLFKIGEGSDHNLVINPDSIAIPFFERYFEYAGIITAKAII